MRMGMGATPFLLALLLQVAFGLPPLQAGLMTFASAAAALVMKTCAPPILRLRLPHHAQRQCGDRGRVVHAYALFRPGDAALADLRVLLTGGFFRSLQFTASTASPSPISTTPQMSRASTMSTMGQQLSQSIGIGMAAMLLHFSMVHAHATHLTAGIIAPSLLDHRRGGADLDAVLPAPAQDAGAEPPRSAETAAEGEVGLSVPSPPSTEPW